MATSTGGGKIDNFKEYEMYKYFCGFDPRFLSHECYLPLISRRINNYYYTKFFENKGLLGLLTGNKVRFPYCFIRCIDGELYDGEMHQISLHEAENIISKQQVIVVKPSIDSSGGKGVRKIWIKDKEESEIKAILSDSGNNYVVQENINQHQCLSKFNESSVNTFRIITLYLNGRVSLCSIILRIGGKGSVVDNLGFGGYMVGINEDGTLKKYGQTLSLESSETYNGITFADEVIEFVPSMVSYILQAHVDAFPLCKFIGWDVTIDANGNFVVIEVNSSQPGVSGSQACNGPIFGDRTQEVIDYCSKKDFYYNKALFNY